MIVIAKLAVSVICAKILLMREAIVAMAMEVTEILVVAMVDEVGEKEERERRERERETFNL